MTGQRAVIYCRVSTDEQARGYSLQTQLAECKDYAKRMEYMVLETFKDDYTGESLDRPDLDRLREFITRNPVEVVIVYDLDRLARKSVYQMLIEEELRAHGAVVEYVNGQYADTDEGRLQKQIKASIAEYEKAKILERSKRGKRGKAQGGFAVVAARPPYGYQVKSEPHKSWLERDEDEARIVRLVYEWYLYGNGQVGPLSMSSIAAELTRLDIPTRGDKCTHVAKKSGHGVWTAGMIRHILTNETYTGTWHYGKTKMVKDNNKKQKPDKSRYKRGLGKQVARPRDEWVKVTVPSIISRVDFDAVQGRLSLNKEQAKRSVKHDYLLGRRVKCLKCGYSYVGRTRREHLQYYYCKGSEQKPVKLCDMPQFRADEVEETVWQWIKYLMQHPDQLAEGLRVEKSEAERANSGVYARLALIDAKIAENQDKLDKLLDLYLDGRINKEVLAEREARLKSTLADLRTERADLSEHLQINIPTDEEINSIVAYCEEIGVGLDNATFEDKRRYFDWLNVRGKLAVEVNEKVVYAKCRIGEQRLSLVLTSPLSNTGATAIRSCGCPPTPHCR